MKRIVYIHHGGNQGGAPRSLKFLVQQLDRSLYEPYIICMSDRRNIPFFEEAGAKVIFDEALKPYHGSTVSGMNWKMFLKNTFGVLPTYFRTKKIIKNLKPDLIHLNSTCLFPIAAACKKVFPKVPIICHVREPLLKGFFGDILRRENNKLVDHYIAIEQYDADSLHNDHVPTSVVYNFVDLKEYAYSEKTKVFTDLLGISEKDFIVLYLARFAPSNGALELAQAFDNSPHHNIHLVMIGDKESDQSEYALRIRKIAEENNSIHILGFRSDVPQMLAGADVIVCPFLEPHFARTVIEAGAVGRASIVSNVGGLSELVKHNEIGLVYDVNNFSECIEYIKALQEDPEKLKELAIHANEYAHENFEAKRNAAKIFDIYEQLI